MVKQECTFTLSGMHVYQNRWLSDGDFTELRLCLCGKVKPTAEKD